MTLALDGRDAEALEAALRRTVAGTTFAALLEQAPEEPALALLRALLAAEAGAIAHLDALPRRMRGVHLEQRLGIERLGVVADRLIAAVEADPKRVPATLPAQARIKAEGGRIYETAESLRVLGARVVGVRAHRLTSTDDRVAVALPLRPFGATTDPEAPHELLIASDLLRFDSGSAVVRLTLIGLRIDGRDPTTAAALALLAQLRLSVSDASGWRGLGMFAVSQAAGDRAYTLVSNPFPAPTAPVELAGAPRYVLRCALPPAATAGFARADALALTFTAAELAVAGTGIQPQAAYVNGGLVDLSGEVEPFGPAPRRGAHFTLRADEAFGKPITSLSVATAVAAGTGAGGTPGVQWEHLTGGRWTRLGDASRLLALAQTTVTATGRPLSERVELADAPGHCLRARIATGDYGFDAYEGQLRTNAAIVANQVGKIVAATPPTPLALTTITVSYSAVATDAGLFARNGASLPMPLDGAAKRPFFAEPAGKEGAFYVGLDARATRGEVVSLYVDVDEATACDPAPRKGTIRFAYDSGAGGWQPLNAIDGTLGLRQSGILRFVAPLDWADGSPTAGATDGRWLRVESTAAGLAGTVRELRTDAVEARYVLTGPDDPTPATPLAADALKNLERAVPGIKRVMNPRPSTGGRGPEPDAGFARRASGVVRHRNRAITAWDVEELLTHEFPELALVRCLAHHSRTSECAPGSVAIIVVPRSAERAPVPTVRLAAEIARFVSDRATAWVDVNVLCAEYVPVGVSTTAVLQRGVVAGEAQATLLRDLDTFLHPLGGLRRTAGFGRPLFRSELLQYLEGHPLVDFVGEDGLDFLGAHAGFERLDVHPCRGLITAAGEHDLKVQATL